MPTPRPSPHPLAGATIALLATVAALGCGSAPPAVPPPAPAPDPCTVRPDAPPPPTITLALTDSIDPAHAPVPRTAAERLVFAQMYETLVWFDCNGRARPGLAFAWSADSGRRNWTVTLRDDARFWDGERITAAGVVAAWRANGTGSRYGTPAIEWVTVLDERRLIVTFAERSEDIPAALADPALAVTRANPGSWSMGSGPYRPAGATELVPINSPSPTLRLTTGSADPRDALDRGADLLVTDDPITIDYARTRADLRATPLPWTATYLLVIPPGQDTAGIVPTGAAGELQRHLARDAVRAETRPAEMPSSWADGRCADATTARHVRPVRREADRIVYPAADATARELAERLVALARRRLVAVPVGPEELTTSLRSGREAAYVVAVPRDSTDLCGIADDWRPGSTVVPLVDARAHAITRRTVPAFVVTRSGVLRFLQAESP